MKRFVVILLILLAVTTGVSPLFAQVAIETEVSQSRLAIGEQLRLDIIVSNADGKVARPSFSTIQGFTSYSQGHSQEISIINGRSSSRNIFSYILIANSPGKKIIGPFEIQIDGRPYKIAAVEVEVTQGSGFSQSPTVPYAYSKTPVSAPPSRAQAVAGVDKEDIFVKVWLDRDEVYINEPAMLTYTLYTRLSATYKGFETEPVTTDFWVEDFPPDKTIKRTEQILNGSRYVVADVRKMALFPTEAGVFTIDPGVLSADVEVFDQDGFNSFFSYNVFGRRTVSSPFINAQTVAKKIPTEKLTLTVKALPDEGKPENFTGAIGGYIMTSSVDKKEVEAGTPVTYKLRIGGQGNINTVQPPTLPSIEGVKVYDSSTATNISKDRLLVEGEKTVETVMVPKKAGSFTIPSLEFSFFNPVTQSYKTLKTPVHTILVKPGLTQEEDRSSSGKGLTPADKEDVSVTGRDIRYIKTSDSGVAPATVHTSPIYWILNGIFLIISLLIAVLSGKKITESDVRASRQRRSHTVARRKLKEAEKLLNANKPDEFYAEIQRALNGYFADKMNIHDKSVTFDQIEGAVQTDEKSKEGLAELKALYDELGRVRFASVAKEQDEMKKIYQMADRVITAFERARFQ